MELRFVSASEHTPSQSTKKVTAPIFKLWGNPPCGMSVRIRLETLNQETGSRCLGFLVKKFPLSANVV